MSPFVTAGAAVLGVVAGAFIPHIAYRLSVPFGTPPRAACAACHAPFARGAQGWVRPSARCPHCRARSGASPVWSAVAGGLACGGLAAALHSWALLAIALPVAVAGVLLALIDVACMRLPDVIVLPLLGLTAAGLAIVSISTGTHGALARAAVAAAGLAGFYLVLGFAVPSGVGLGDVKLALVLGLILGWLGWGFVLAAAVVAHLIHGGMAVALLIAGRADRKTLLPMGPALLAGAWLSIAVVPVVFGVFGA